MLGQCHIETLPCMSISAALLVGVVCIYSCVFNVPECPVVRDQRAVLKAVVLISQNVRSVVHSQPYVYILCFYVRRVRIMLYIAWLLQE